MWMMVQVLLLVSQLVVASPALGELSQGEDNVHVVLPEVVDNVEPSGIRNLADGRFGGAISLFAPNARQADRSGKSLLEDILLEDIPEEEEEQLMVMERKTPEEENVVIQEETEEDRLAKSLIDTFPFNSKVAHHGNHDAHDGHDNHAGHGDHGAHGPHGDHSIPSHSDHDRHVGNAQFREEDEQEGSANAADNEVDPTAIDLAELEQAGERCVEKVMMVEETVYEDKIECHHSYSKRCHTSYVTNYEPQQQEKCDENFRKNCYIEYNVRVFNETVDVCHQPQVKNCNRQGPIVCTTEYESVCETKQHEHEVEEDVTDCVEENMEKCEDITKGYTTSTKCHTWPVTRCTLETKTVKKYTPETSCKKIPTELCGPKACASQPGPKKCRKQQKQVVQEVPNETCNIVPQKTCKFVTKLVPKLTPRQECVDVPKEVCTKLRGNPKKVKKPVIKKWCYVPTVESGLEK